MSEDKFPMVITAALPAGGTGKTPFVRIFGEWLARQGKKVALFDFDHQCSLSEMFEIYQTENTSLNIFQGGKVDFLSLENNLWLVPGHPNLQYEPARLRANGTQNIYFLFEDWIYQHEEEIKAYDYLLIDTHPDTDTITKNALTVSTAQVGVIMPTEKSVNAISKAEQALIDLKEATFDRRHQEALVTCELVLLGTDIEKIGKSYTKLSQQLLDLIENDKRFVGFIPHKELFNQAMSDQKLSIWEILNDKKYLNNPSIQLFKEKLGQTMQQVDKRIKRINNGIRR